NSQSAPLSRRAILGFAEEVGGSNTAYVTSLGGGSGSRSCSPGTQAQTVGNGVSGYPRLDRNEIQAVSLAWVISSAELSPKNIKTSTARDFSQRWIQKLRQRGYGCATRTGAKLIS